jgi:hypothetical protein
MHTFHQRPCLDVEGLSIPYLLSPPQADRGGFVAISAVDHDRGPEIVNKGPFEPNNVLLSINRLQLTGDIVASRVLQRTAKSGTCCTCNGQWFPPKWQRLRRWRC